MHIYGLPSFLAAQVGPKFHNSGLLTGRNEQCPSGTQRGCKRPAATAPNLSRKLHVSALTSTDCREPPDMPGAAVLPYAASGGLRLTSCCFQVQHELHARPRTMAALWLLLGHCSTVHLLKSDCRRLCCGDFVAPLARKSLPCASHE